MPIAPNKNHVLGNSRNEPLGVALENWLLILGLLLNEHLGKDQGNLMSVFVFNGG